MKFGVGKKNRAERRAIWHIWTYDYESKAHEGLGEDLTIIVTSGFQCAPHFSSPAPILILWSRLLPFLAVSSGNWSVAITSSSALRFDGGDTIATTVIGAIGGASDDYKVNETPSVFFSFLLFIFFFIDYFLPIKI